MTERRTIFVSRMVLVLFITSSFNVTAVRADMDLSLQEALGLAQSRHVNVIVSEERVKQALTRIQEGRSVFVPQLRFNASEIRQTRDLRTTGTTLPGQAPLIGPFSTFDTRIKITQTIFDPASVERLRAAEQGYGLLQIQQEKIREDTLALVAVLFIEARRAAQQLAAQRIVVTRDEKKLGIARERLASGQGTPFEVKQAEANFERSSVFLTTAESAAIERRLDIAAALGIPLGEKINFLAESDSLIFPPEPKIAEESGDALPDVRVAEATLKQSKKEERAEKGEYWPKVSALGDYGPSGDHPNSGGSSETYSVGVQVSMPVFEGGLRSARVHAAESRVREDAARLVDAKNQSQARVLTARQNVVKAEALLRESQAQWTVARQAQDLSEQRIQAGIGTEIEELETRADLALATDGKDEAAATYLTAQINLAHALGQLRPLMGLNKEENKP